MIQALRTVCDAIAAEIVGPLQKPMQTALAELYAAQDMPAHPELPMEERMVTAIDPAEGQHLVSADAWRQIVETIESREGLGHQWTDDEIAAEVRDLVGGRKEFARSLERRVTDQDALLNATRRELGSPDLPLPAAAALVVEQRDEAVGTLRAVHEATGLSSAFSSALEAVQAIKRSADDRAEEIGALRREIEKLRVDAASVKLASQIDEALVQTSAPVVVDPAVGTGAAVQPIPRKALSYDDTPAVLMENPPVPDDWPGRDKQPPFVPAVDLLRGDFKPAVDAGPPPRILGEGSRWRAAYTPAECVDALRLLSDLKIPKEVAAALKVPAIKEITAANISMTYRAQIDYAKRLSGDQREAYLATVLRSLEARAAIQKKEAA